jgi:hypothetical protein
MPILTFKMEDTPEMGRQYQYEEGERWDKRALKPDGAVDKKTPAEDEARQWLDNLRTREQLIRDVVVKFRPKEYEQYRRMFQAAEADANTGNAAKALAACDSLTQNLNKLIRAAETERDRTGKQARLENIVQKIRKQEPEDIGTLTKYEKAAFAEYQKTVETMKATQEAGKFDEAETLFASAAAQLKAAIDKAQRTREKHKELMKDLKEVKSDVDRHPLVEHAPDKYAFCLEVLKRAEAALKEVDNNEAEKQLLDAQVTFKNFITAARERIEHKKKMIIAGVVSGILLLVALAALIVFFMKK